MGLGLLAVKTVTSRQKHSLKCHLIPSSSKTILSNKRRLEDYETVALTEECSAILQNKLPPKLKDPGSFSIPYLIGNMNIDKALCDLGPSEDVQIPIILGRPFIATVAAVIDVKNGLLTLKVGDEEVEFNLFNTMKHKLEPDECFKVDIIDKQVVEEFIKAHPKDPLGASIVHSHTAEKENTEIVACA
ncbi:uncharacterized protein LOC131179460 [Hevea brasiliensis]|uniref:uncharacterized protein LOC131179460 n=1 Tax=Hevea brasiliensis TaxID=3981 RepID=UPI0025F61B68|nr:uncharacterized protein LOC131179460 [Hevea brasiliensis]